MSFRNDNDAWHEREKAELRNKLGETRKELERAKAAPPKVVASNKAPSPKLEPFDPFPSVSDKQIEDYENKLLKKSANGLYVDSFSPHKGLTWPTSDPFRRSTDWGPIIKLGIVGLVMTLGIGLAIHHEFWDIRDGYVTAKTYTPGHWSSSCSTDSHGHRTCSQIYHPPTWNVTVNFEGDSASWGVTENEYEHINYGDWYCARDFLHEGSCVRNHPAFVDSQ